jgi:hypothetical protein
MTDRRLGHLLWRVADQLDHLLTLARLRFLDALAGPEPETDGDQQRKPDRDRRSPRSSREELGRRHIPSPIRDSHLLPFEDTRPKEFRWLRVARRARGAAGREFDLVRRTATSTELKDERCRAGSAFYIQNPRRKSCLHP